MTTLAENPGAKLNYGIRGGIPSARMEQIHLGLAYPMKLQQILPFLVDPLVTLMKPSKMKATIRLSDGWHVLNQARIGLVEAEACKVYYEEIEPNRIEAIFWSRYYLDDAALRLHSSCEHLLRSIDHYWTLRVSNKGLPVDGSPPSRRSRDGLLVRVLSSPCLKSGFYGKAALAEFRLHRRRYNEPPAVFGGCGTPQNASKSPSQRWRGFRHGLLDARPP